MQFGIDEISQKKGEVVCNARLGKYCFREQSLPVGLWSFAWKAFEVALHSGAMPPGFFYRFAPRGGQVILTATNERNAQNTSGGPDTKLHLGFHSLCIVRLEVHLETWQESQSLRHVKSIWTCGAAMVKIRNMFA